MSAKIPSPTELQLLLLVSSELSGREVATRYLEEYGKRISFGTLYTTFRRLREAGLVRVRDGADDDGRIRYFSISADGIVAAENAARYYSALSRLPRRALGL